MEIAPTVSQLLTEPPKKVAERPLSTSTLNTAKLMTLLPADRAADLVVYVLTLSALRTLTLLDIPLLTKIIPRGRKLYN